MFDKNQSLQNTYCIIKEKLKKNCVNFFLRARQQTTSLLDTNRAILK